MTDNEIIKAMQCVIGNDVSCSECEYQKALPFPSCRRMCAKNALDLINRQKAENERLQKNIDGLNIFTKNHIKVIKLQAIKEFVERLKQKLQWDVEFDNKIVFESDIDNLIKEMTEPSEWNQRKEDEGK